MSFFCQRAIYLFVDLAILVLIANELYKMLAVLKRRQFDDDGNDKIELRGSKCQQLDLRDNNKEESFDKLKGKDKKENIRYVLLLFVPPL